jgi:signal transduction histidine kinase
MTDDQLNMTERRRVGLEAVRDGRVTFVPATALYYIDQEAAGNWDRRTFAELRRYALINVEGSARVVPMVLTDAGRAILEPPAEPAEG